MLTNQLAVKYAQALYELASEKQVLEITEQELRFVENTIASYDDLSTLMYHPQVLAQAKKETIHKVFGQDIHDFVLNFLLLLVDKRRESILPAIISEYATLANKARNIVEAEVTTALPLGESQHTALANKLSQVTGKTIVLKTQINQGIIGGMIVKIGDKLIDGSVVRQLATLKKALLNNEVTGIEVTD
ncbi:F0F1 ATP synthase subunit delta [Pelosinus propionicus]|uniref:ATP synthase subunit delta n=1 Tax=Pelosinus propionicus DSM 13327 TaxID=1123291 RepID=A0A1I4J7T9_9FIRM|nr:F0F1 ATP synthase subunit delta [Pelosinus propionicus]SFL62629.1 ATP synthase F1 subcomplex delta subunit [Pelosinus propionicus DSM 13327]